MPDQPKVSLIEWIQKRPGMYVGDPSSPKAALTVVRELLANVVDLYLSNQASFISIQQDKDGWITVVDDGPGLPFSDIHPDSGLSIAEHHFTKGHDSPTADGHTPHIHLGTYGIGLILINALSDRVIVKSVKQGIKFCQDFEKGKASPIKSTSTDEVSGTKISFLLNPEVFGEFRFLDWSIVRKECFTIAHLYPGLLVEYEQERFCSRNGLEDYVELLTVHLNGLDTPRAVACIIDDGEYRINFACGGSREKNEPVFVKSWVNGWYCDSGGTHIDGMKLALNKANLDPSVAMISLVLDAPRFGSPTKSKLVSVEARDEVSRRLLEHFEEVGLI